MEEISCWIGGVIREEDRGVGVDTVLALTRKEDRGIGEDVADGGSIVVLGGLSCWLGGVIREEDRGIGVVMVSA